LAIIFPDLHGAFATRGDAFKRLALVASALDSPTPAFDAGEWETASKTKCAAINNKTEAATKRFVSLLQAEMDYGTARRCRCSVVWSPWRGSCVLISPLRVVRSQAGTPKTQF
jgi:hypothetical protein